MNTPYLIQVTPPAIEPLSLEETKKYLRVDHTDEDPFIAGLITIARETAEQYMKRSLITQSWMLSFDDYTPSEVFLPRGPVQSITSVKIIAKDTSETVIDSSTYYLNAGKEKLVFEATPVGHIVEIVYQAGFGDSSAKVPPQIKQGILAHVASLYDQRDQFVPLGETSISLFSSYRVVKL